MSETWTIQRVLAWMGGDFQKLGLPSPRLDAELLLCEALSIDRVRLYMDMGRPLLPAELSCARTLVERRRAHEPVAYITGRREFYGRDFKVNPDVLIPRPETEVLIDVALERMPRDSAVRVLDLCSGSGVIATTLACERTAIGVDATDISGPALIVARDNASTHGVAERIAFHQGDLFEPLAESPRFDLVACNPPYVAETELAALSADVRDHEPRVALTAGDDGLGVLRRLCSAVPNHLATEGTVLIEVGAGQSAQVMAWLKDAGLTKVGVRADLSGVPRIVHAQG